MTKDYALQHVKAAEEMCRLRPSPDALADLASCYFTLDQSEKAEPIARASWQMKKVASTGINFGIILKDLGKHDESLQVFEQAYNLDPDNFYIRLAYSEGLLKAGFWKQAWPLYDNARPTQQGAALSLEIPSAIREWQGEPLGPGQRILVINEGGHGDRLSYARWLPELTRLGIDWVFYPYDELFSFFERIFPVERLVKNDTDVDFTYWTTTFALPAKLVVVPTQVPPPLPFIALPEKIKNYTFNRTDARPIIGLCYSAAEKFQGDRKVRSLTEGQAMRLVCMTGDKVHWVSLQHNTLMPYPVTNLPFGTWEDTAGLLHNLDGVVTVDTGLMHLAGAMNKPMAVLLSANSCWKYLRKGKKLPWYPSATFYRNEDRGFEQAINDLVVAIRNNTAFTS